MTAVMALPRSEGTWLHRGGGRFPWPLVPAVVAFLLYLPPALRVVQLSPDAVEYVDVARRLLAGEGYVLGVKAYHVWGTEVLHDGLAERPPLFVLLIAATLGLGLGLPAVQVLNALLAAACVGLMATIGAHLFGQRVGLATGLLAAASPVLLARLVPPMSEALAISVTLVAVWLVLLGMRTSRAVPFALAGAALGLGYLTRPTVAVCLPALLIGVLAAGPWRGIARRLAALVGGALLFILPMSVYSAITRGSLSYSGQSYLYSVFKDADVLRNGYGRPLPTAREFVSANPDFVLAAILENVRDYGFLLFADRDWLWPLLLGAPLALLAAIRGRYPREALVVVLVAAANFAIYAATWSNYQERYQILTMLLLLPFLVDGFDRLFGLLARRLVPMRDDQGRAKTLRRIAHLGLLAALVGAVAASWAPTFAEQYRGEFRYGDEPTRTRVDGGLRWTGPPRWVEDNDLAKVVDWVRDRTEARDVLAHREPWPYTFLTRRPATLLPTRLPAERLRTFLAEYRVSYVLLDTRDRDRRAYADDLDALAAEDVSATTVGSHRIFDTRALWAAR